MNDRSTVEIFCSLCGYLNITNGLLRWCFVCLSTALDIDLSGDFDATPQYVLL